MTRHEIARLACRLMALYFILQAIASIGILVLWLTSALALGSDLYRANISGTIASMVPPAMAGAIGLWLWKKSDWMASRMLHDSATSAVGFEVNLALPTELPVAQHLPRTEAPAPMLSAADWTVIGFMVAGVLVLVDGIHAFMGVAYTAFMSFRTYQSMRQLQANPVITAVAKTVIGLWLLLGSRGIVGVLRGVRGKYADQPTDGENSERAS